MKSKIVRLWLISLLVLLASSACSATELNYTSEALKKAKADNKVILLVFHADWCPTCRKQKPVVDKILLEQKYKKFVSLFVNFDDEETLKREYNISSQSSLILLKGSKEIGREVGITDETQIRTFLNAGFN